MGLIWFQKRPKRTVIVTTGERWYAVYANVTPHFTAVDVSAAIWTLNRTREAPETYRRALIPDTVKAPTDNE